MAFGFVFICYGEKLCLMIEKDYSKQLGFKALTGATGIEWGVLMICAGFSSSD